MTNAVATVKPAPGVHCEDCILQPTHLVHPQPTHLVHLEPTHLVHLQPTHLHFLTPPVLTLTPHLQPLLVSLKMSGGREGTRGFQLPLTLLLNLSTHSFSSSSPPTPSPLPLLLLQPALGVGHLDVLGVQQLGGSVPCSVVDVVGGKTLGEV